MELQLFERSARGIELTDAGRYLFLEAEQLLGRCSQIETHLGEISKDKATGLRIGTKESYAVHLWPRFAAAFNQKHRGVPLDLVVSKSNKELLGKLEEKKLDAVIIPNPPSVEWLTSYHIFDDRWQFFRHTELETAPSGDDLLFWCWYVGEPALHCRGA